MDFKTALGYAREFLRLYWANETAHEEWSRMLEAEFGLTAKQYALLRAVERQGDITTSDLTDMMGKAQPAITQMLNRLEENGFIRREVSTTDKRKREVRLTDKALGVIGKVEPIGPTRVAMAIETSGEREAGEIVRAMDTVFNWMTKRKVK